MNTEKRCFDDQAARFDRRAGLPDELCPQLARSLLELCRASSGDLLLEIGAGTGQIGRHLHGVVRYLGLDLSAPMLGQFRRRAGARLVQADADQDWPVAGASVRILFGSRVFHLLESQHLSKEAYRVAHPEGAVLLSGQIRRHPDSVQARMRQEMRRLLKQQGWPGKSRRHSFDSLLESACQRGAVPISPIVAARWEVSATPRHSIEAWKGKKGLAGVFPSPQAKQQVLQELADWAETSLGSLDRQFQSEQTYVLEGFRVPGSRFQVSDSKSSV